MIEGGVKEVKNSLLYKLKIVSIILCLLCYKGTGFVHVKVLAIFSSSTHSVNAQLVHIFINNFPAGDSSYMSVIRIEFYRLHPQNWLQLC